MNESVTLAKKYCKNPKAGALVNAVLRKAAATKGTLQEPVSYADRYSHPDELISLLKANLPKGKLEPMLIADNAAPQTVVQVNTLRISAEKLAERLTAEHVCVKPHEWMADCLVLSGTALDGVSAVGLEDTDGDALYAPLTANDLALTDPATDAQS